MPSFYTIGSENLREFLEGLREKHEIFTPGESQEKLHYEPFKPDEKPVLSTFRAVEPLKSFIYRLKEPVAGFPSSTEPLVRDIALVGVKNCDLRSLKVLDAIFNTEELRDPFYCAQRDSTLTISSDCYVPAERCFCNLVDLKPYPEEGFDLNLSEIDGEFILEVGSERGESLVNSFKDLFEEASQEKLSQREERRKASLEKLIEQNSPYQFERPYYQVVKESSESDVWEEQAERCVECGCCNLICPTCYYFLLSDVKVGDGFQRIRTWDSCMYAGFSRVAAGTNPRARLGERLRHRFMHKFVYLMETIRIYGYTGCGRCGEGCLGGIDVREVLKELNLSLEG